MIFYRTFFKEIILYFDINKKILLALLVLIAVGSATGLNLDYENQQVHEDADTGCTIFIPCSGGSGEYVYEYSHLPQGWTVREEKFHVPKSDCHSTRSFGFRINVVDKVEKISLKRVVILRFADVNVDEILETDFDFELDDEEKFDNYVRENKGKGYRRSEEASKSEEGNDNEAQNIEAEIVHESGEGSGEGDIEGASADKEKLKLKGENRKVERDDEKGERKIFIPCEGGSGEYTYEYSHFPAGWYAKDNKIHVPNDVFESNKAYGLRVLVTDTVLNIFLKRVVIIKFSETELEEILDTDFDFDVDSSVKVSEFVHEHRVRREREEKVAVESDEETVDEATADEATADETDHQLRPHIEIPTRPVVDRPQIPTAPLDEVVQKSLRRDDNGETEFVLISTEELEVIIREGNIAELKKIIESVISSSLTCQEKSSFLSELLTRIEGFLAVEDVEVEKVRKAIVVFQLEIKERRTELRDLEAGYINVNALEVQISHINSQLNALVLPSVDESLHAKIASAEAEIYELKTVTIIEAEGAIATADIEISTVDSEIESLEAQLLILRQKRSDAVRIKKEHQVIITNAHAKIQALEISIEKVKIQIAQIEGLIIQYNDKKAFLLLEIERLELEVNEANLSNEERRVRVEELKSLIVNKEKKVEVEVTHEETRRGIISSHRATLSEFRRRIDRQVFSCDKVIVVEEDYSDDEEAAKVEKETFIKHLNRKYGKDVKVENVEIEERFVEKVRVRRINIFIGAWVKKYGLAVDFGTCGAEVVEAEVESHKGKIVSIDKNVVKVKEDESAEEYDVHVGGCTEVETATETEVPEVGDSIYWRGFKRGDNRYHQNALRCTCY